MVGAHLVRTVKGVDGSVRWHGVPGLLPAGAALLWLVAWPAAAGLPVAESPTTAVTPSGRYIAWNEHIIDSVETAGPTLSGSDGLVVADVDLDGFEDVVSVHESDVRYDGVPDGHVRIAFGSADPRQWQTMTLLDGPAAAAPEDASLADVNGDGYPDVIVACELAHLVYLQNPGPGRTRELAWQRLIVPITENRGSFIRAFFADVDGDGRPEVAAANKGAQNPTPDTEPAAISVFDITGDPLDPAAWSEVELGRYPVPQNAEPVDIDGDGDLDIVGGVRVEGRLIVFENVDPQRLRFVERPVRIDGARMGGFNLEYADLDGDGRLDIVGAVGRHELGWIAQPETLSGTWQVHRIGAFAPDSMTGIELADIDGDGDLDVMAGSYSRGPRDRDGAEVTVDDPLGRLGWFENPGRATTSWQRHDISRRVRGMYDKFVARDVDGDGDVDFLGTRGNSYPFDGVFWLEQTRTAEPRRAFQPARDVDSREMPLPTAPVAGDAAEPPARGPEKQAYFGDLHVHTKYSYDAFVGGVRATPDDAYRYARGGTLWHPGGFPLRLSGPPLDFFAVTDHAKYLGALQAVLDRTSPLYQHPARPTLERQFREGDVPWRQAWAAAVAEYPELGDPRILHDAWNEVIAAAERHYEPGRFTTFIGYEYTLTPGGRHLHRNVIFRGDRAPQQPFSSLDSDDPQDLWAWLDRLRRDGIDGMAIPHNPNQSNGGAFARTTFDGMPMDEEYAAQRLRNERVVEMIQIKGASETHPALSPNDEWADFGIVQYALQSEEGVHLAGAPISVFAGGYARDALKTGLEMEQSAGFNPYRLGMIGSSDIHGGAASYDERQYSSGMVHDMRPMDRGSGFSPGATSWDEHVATRRTSWTTGGLAAVWAEENTRPAIFDALRRREAFATSGPRIRVRFFAGLDMPASLIDEAGFVDQAYQRGVPMGGEIHGSDQREPRFFVWAARDPNSYPLQRVQIVKGWVEDGAAREQVFDVACSDGNPVDEATQRCPDNGARVDLTDCSVNGAGGSSEIRTAWQDPAFEPRQRAFYYVRVLENPSCRWSTWDAVRQGIPPNPDVPATIQERAYSSPIWYLPATSAR